MQDQGTSGYGPTGNPPYVEDRVIARSAAVGYAPGIGVQIGENQMQVRDRVQWGPIFAGLATAIAAMVIFTVLGIALGASVLDRNAPGEDIGSWAVIWGAASALVAFFLGGVVAAKSAAVAGPGTGMLNGLMVGCAALVLILWLTGTGLGNLFGTVGANLGDISTAVLGTSTTADEAVGAAEDAVADAQGQAANVEAELRARFDEVRDGAWGTLAGLILPLAAATFGGWIAHNKRRDLIEGTG